MDDLIATNDVEPQPIVSIRDRLRPDGLPAFLKTTFPELLERLRIVGVSPTGPPFVIYHNVVADDIDAEVSLPVSAPIAAAGRIGSRVLPAMTVACTVHVGPYEALGDAYTALSDWITSHGFAATGPIYERYLNGPGHGVATSEYRTQIDLRIVGLRRPHV